MTIGQKIPTKPKEYTQEELELQRELLRFKDSRIFVNTEFKRKSEPIFALAFSESQRNLAIDKEKLAFKTDMEILDIVSDMVVKHYSNSHGTIGIWGEIKNYAYHHRDGKVYIFDTDGQLIKDAEVIENRAVCGMK